MIESNAHVRIRHLRRLIGILAVAFMTTACTRNNSPDSGGSSNTTSTSAASATAPPKSASDLLNRMAGVYRDAKTYADAGKLRFRYLLDGKESSEEVDFSIAFSRPALLRAHIYQAIIVADGKKLHATISDLPGQVLEADLTEKLTPDDLMSDPTLAQVISQGIGGEAPQLALLLHADALAPMISDAESTKLLESADVDGARCYQVEVLRPDGRLVFFIDEKSSALRRIVYPVRQLSSQLAQAGNYTEVELVAEFTGARLNGEIDPVAFQFEKPADGQIVASFAPGQGPATPAPKLLGQQVPEFAFQTLDGKPLTRESLQGKVVVLDFWFATCVYCFEQLPELQKVYEKYKDDPRVVFAAVNVDDPATPAAEVKAAFDKSQSTIPVVRDIGNHADQTFQVAGYPSLFVLDGKGVVQIAHVGLNKQIATELPQKLDSILSGKEIYQDEIREHEAKQQQLRDETSSAGEAPPLPVSTVAEKSDPQHLKLTPLWTSDEIERPGNILAIPEPGETARFFVNDGWNAVVELDANGKKTARREFKVPESAIISFLRTTTDATGKRYFAGSTSAEKQQQLFLFDESWNQLLAFPDTEHAGIADVQFGDLNNDGQPEINVSYWGVVGVQNVSLAGKRNWSNRTMENVFRMVVTGPDAAGRRSLWCANGRGALAPIDADGKESEQIVVEGKFIRSIFSEDLNFDQKPEFAAIAINQEGVDTILGLSDQGKEQWRHEMPRGLYQAPVEAISAGNLIGDAEKQWIIAGADGSIHILKSDGTLVDRFNHGAVVNGFAAANIGGKPVLLISSGNAIQAWTVENAAQ